MEVMNMKKLFLKAFVAFFVVCDLFLASPNNLLAQYEGAATVGQVLGAHTEAGLPAWVLALLALLIGFLILFFAWFAWKRHKKQ
jgi:Zn-dependent protease with chaperone function